MLGATYRRLLVVAPLSPPAAPPGPCQAPAARSPELPRRAFHCSMPPLGFRSTPASWAGPCPGEGEGEGVDTGAEKGLEIARLGTSPRIMEKLAARGITRLFPIQVLPLSW